MFLTFSTKKETKPTKNWTEKTFRLLFVQQQTLKLIRSKAALILKTTCFILETLLVLSHCLAGLKLPRKRKHLKKCFVSLLRVDSPFVVILWELALLSHLLQQTLSVLAHVWPDRNAHGDPARVRRGRFEVEHLRHSHHHGHEPDEEHDQDSHLPRRARGERSHDGVVSDGTRSCF